MLSPILFSFLRIDVVSPIIFSFLCLSNPVHELDYDVDLTAECALSHTSCVDSILVTLTQDCLFTIVLIREF